MEYAHYKCNYYYYYYYFECKEMPNLSNLPKFGWIFVFHLMSVCVLVSKLTVGSFSCRVHQMLLPYLQETGAHGENRVFQPRLSVE